MHVYATMVSFMGFQKEKLERNAAIMGLTFQFEKNNGIELLLI